MKYKVVWEMEIEASSPLKAAERALEIQRDPNSIATIFNVIDSKGREKTIDLDVE